MRYIALIAILLMPGTAMACFVGNYENAYGQAQWLLLFSGLLSVLGVGLFTYHYPRYWMFTIITAVVAILYPVLNVYRSWGVCCDCGYGVLFNIKILLSIGELYCLTSIYCFYKYERKT